MGAPGYQFEPKSNAHLLPAQFWGVPLSDGRWACGRVLAIKTEPDEYFLHTDEVAEDGPRRPDLARRTDSTLRVARLTAERDAVAAMAPDAEARLRVLDTQLRLEQVGQHRERGRRLRLG